MSLYKLEPTPPYRICGKGAQAYIACAKCGKELRGCESCEEDGWQTMFCDECGDGGCPSCGMKCNE